ncbi:hypothetical protein [uncultured Helicobacter sp.]|uniref:hypothetical protein n=1 Tax=uncultured Helicobacter sp. TaxID=175537 RepID=UPI00374F8B60
MKLGLWARFDLWNPKPPATLQNLSNLKIQRKAMQKSHSGARLDTIWSEKARV